MEPEGSVAADYVVVGAGAAGCVVAGRLVRLGAGSVLLVEAGGSNRDPRLQIPLAFALALQHPRFTHRYATRVETPASPNAGHQHETWVRGRGVGGSTSINGMLYARGEPADYDALAAAGNPGWGWEHVGPAFAALEAGRLQGDDVPGLTITLPPVRAGLPRLILDAAAQVGICPVEDVHDAAGERIARTPSTIRRGRRVSAATAFLGMGHSALQVLRHTTAEAVLFDGERAVGVLAHQRGTPLRLRAHREVVLAAGTIESSALLERSGIGDPAILSRASVPVRVARTRVGTGVIEQRAVTVKAGLRPGFGDTFRLATRSGRMRSGVRYLLRRDGLLATGPFPLTALVRATEASSRPDAQVLFSGLLTDDTGLALADHAGVLVQGYPLRPTTTSTIHITGPRADDPLDIRARYLDTEDDRRVTVGILRRIREVLSAPPLADVVLCEEAPGADVTTEEAILRYVRSTGSGIYHAVGACAMGPHDDAVVDADLRVRGVDGLRVVDASVLPTMLSGGTAAPTMVVAWLAAARIAAG